MKKQKKKTFFFFFFFIISTRTKRACDLSLRKWLRSACLCCLVSIWHLRTRIFSFSVLAGEQDQCFHLSSWVFCNMQVKHSFPCQLENKLTTFWLTLFLHENNVENTTVLCQKGMAFDRNIVQRNGQTPEKVLLCIERLCFCCSKVLLLGRWDFIRASRSVHSPKELIFEPKPGKTAGKIQKTIFKKEASFRWGKNRTWVLVFSFSAVPRAPSRKWQKIQILPSPKMKFLGQE